jgi:hypothetical protein
VLLTDDLPACRQIGRQFPAHLAVDHSRDEYFRRDPPAAATARVNTAGSFNAAQKRCRVGVHHVWSTRHSHRYLNQQVFHGNHRDTGPAMRLTALFSARSRRLRFPDGIARIAHRFP